MADESFAMSAALALAAESLAARALGLGAGLFPARNCPEEAPGVVECLLFFGNCICCLVPPGTWMFDGGAALRLAGPVDVPDRAAGTLLLLRAGVD